MCMHYVTNNFLLVSSSVQSKQLLCFVHRQGQKNEQKHKIKSFVEFYNHSPLLTIVSFTFFSKTLDPSVAKIGFLMVFDDVCAVVMTTCKNINRPLKSVLFAGNLII